MTTAVAETNGLDLNVSDVSGQRTVKATGISGQFTVGELVRALLAKMGLARHDNAGNPLSYRARLEREARHLRESEIVGEALRPEDRIVLQPNIDAGGR